jgi:hypothetical protein
MQKIKQYLCLSVREAFFFLWTPQRNYDNTSQFVKGRYSLGKVFLNQETISRQAVIHLTDSYLTDS